MTNNNETPDSSQEGQDLVLDDDSLEAASGGQNTNSTLIVYASTFVPFDSSF